MQVLEVQGQTIVAPDARSGLHPLVIPLARAPAPQSGVLNSSARGETSYTCLLRWAENSAIRVSSCESTWSAYSLLAGQQHDQHRGRLCLNPLQEQVWSLNLDQRCRLNAAGFIRLAFECSSHLEALCRQESSSFGRA